MNQDLGGPQTGEHLMKCFVEKERLDCRIQRASSVNGWNCASGLSMSSSSPSRMTVSVGKTTIKRYHKRNSKPHNLTVGFDRSLFEK